MGLLVVFCCFCARGRICSSGWGLNGFVCSFFCCVCCFCAHGRICPPGWGLNGTSWCLLLFCCCFVVFCLLFLCPWTDLPSGVGPKWVACGYCCSAVDVFVRLFFYPPYFCLCSFYSKAATSAADPLPSVGIIREAGVGDKFPA